MSQVTRRSFLRGASLGALGIVAGGALTATGCAPEDAAVENRGQDAAGELPGTGEANATLVAENAGVPSWLGAEPVIGDEEITEVIDVDVLVCGIGTTGNFAVPAAAEAGAKVLGISPAPTPIYGVSGVNSRYMIDEGFEWDDATKNQFLNEFVRYGAGNVNPRLIRMWIDHSGETMDWYGERLAAKDVNLYYKHVEKPDDLYRGWAVAHDFVMNAGFDPSVTSSALQEYGTSLGAEYRFGVSLVKLLTDDIGVCGAIAKNDETSEYIQVNTTGGVILCTGSYHANEEMMRALQPYSLEDFCCSNGINMAQGQGIKAALWAGAALDPHQCSMIFDRGALFPDDGAGDLRKKEGAFFQMGSQPFLKVNLYGQRFANESAPYDYILHESEYFPGKLYCTNWDSNWMGHAEQYQTIGCSRFVPDDCSDNAGTLGLVQGQLADLEEKGYIVRADDFHELAEKLNMHDPDEFVRTVERYNELCEKGVDEDFGKESYRMVKLDQPPYFGVRQSGCVGVSLSGVLIDEDMHVLDEKRNPIPGLYAAGTDSGGYFAGTYYNLTDSANGGRCSTQGRRAAQMAATQSREEVAKLIVTIDPVVEEVEVNPDDYQYVDGTYEGAGMSSIGGEVTVTTGIVDGKIAEVSTEHNETDGIGGDAVPILEQQAVENNCAIVDAISGATETTNAFKEALQMALDKAAQ